MRNRFLLVKLIKENTLLFVNISVLDFFFSYFFLLFFFSFCFFFFFFFFFFDGVAIFFLSFLLFLFFFFFFFVILLFSSWTSKNFTNFCGVKQPGPAQLPREVESRYFRYRHWARPAPPGQTTRKLYCCELFGFQSCGGELIVPL